MDYSYTQDRELSWLKFNERVLAEANNKEMPLFERIKFLEIYTNNLDEFFMVRVGSVHDMMLIKPKVRDRRSDMTPAEQLEHINYEVRKLEKIKHLYYDNLVEDLAEIGITRMDIDILGETDKKAVLNHFELKVLPFLTPMVIGKQHPFPHIPNKELHVVVALSGKNKKEKTTFGLVPVPSNLDRLIYLNEEKTKYVLLEDLVLYCCDRIFSNYRVLSKTVIAVTRNADINPDDEVYDSHDDYINHMKKIIKLRGRLRPLRIQIYNSASVEIVNFVKEKFQVDDNSIFIDRMPLTFKHIYTLIDNLPAELREKHNFGPYKPALSSMFQPDVPVMKQIQQGDKLLFFPYESMDTFVQLLKEASEDKDTISIKITIYRLAKNAKIVEYLCRAAENGKEVVALMELRARFDETNNINYSQTLENAGVKVIYGIENYKVHSKICLITRKTMKGVSYITQIGTGNYNETTSKIYTDFSLMTASREIGEDGVRFFHNMMLFNLECNYNHLLVAPYQLKPAFLEMIQNEIAKAQEGKPCGIYMKMNSLTDRDVIDALKDASCAGVPVYLIIRGICCIRPGIKGKTDNIHIESIVGRFLEHTRIYIFGDYTSTDDYRMYISSADMMTRNTQRRVEIAAPVYDEYLKNRIISIVETTKKDNVNAQILQSNDTYVRKSADSGSFDSQKYFITWANNKETQPAMPQPKKSRTDRIRLSFLKKFRKPDRKDR